jgi:vitamin B12 transporter
VRGGGVMWRERRTRAVTKCGIFALSVLLSVAVGPPPASAQTPVTELDTLDVWVSSRVSPGLSARTRTVDVMTREEIRGLPARSVGDLFRWINGVELQQRSGAQADLSLRGAGFEQVLVLVDGVRVSDSQSGHFDLDLAVPIDRIRRIEVLRGPASAMFGADAVGGVVNVVTFDGTRAGAEVPSPSAPSATASAEGGSFGTARLSSTQRVRAGAARITLGEDWATSDGDRTGTDYDNLILHGSLETPLSGGRLELSLGHAARDFGAADFYAPIPSYEETRTTRLVGGWTSGAFGGLQMEVRASLRDHDDEFVFYRDDPGSGRNVHDARQMGGELTLRSDAGPGIGDGIHFALGAEGWRDELESSNLGARSESRGSAFGEMVIPAGGGSVITAGLRADGHEEFGAVVSPSVALAWDLSAAVRLKASAGRSFRPPTWTERYYSDPFHQASSSIDPEEAWSGEVGMVIHPAPGWSIRATGFFRRTENLIDWAKPDGSGDEVMWVTRNVKKADFRGLELDMSGAGPLAGQWELGASFLDVDPLGEAGFFSKRALRPETRRLTLTLIERLHDRVGLTLHGLYAGRRSERPYHQLDVRLWTPLGRGSLFLDILNLTDQDYPDASGQPVPGLGALIGYRLGG